MLKRFMLLVALLAPATALAADQTPIDPQDGSEKDICDQIGEDSTRCAQAWRWCHWDPEDIKCERNPTGQGCDSFHDELSCGGASGCIWDTQDPLGPRCERIS